MLLQTIRFVDTLSARIVNATDCRAMDVELEAVAQQLSQIEAHLAPNNVQGLKHQVDILRSQMQVSCPSCMLCCVRVQGCDSVSVLVACDCCFFVHGV